jgi:hypothetical protein
MAQRVYLIVLDDQGNPEWDWFESVMKGEVLATWNNAGLSEMDHVELTVSAEDADPEDYPEGTERDDADTMDEMADTVATLQRKIAEDKN